MATMTTAGELIDDYYGAWSPFDKTRLEALLAEDLDFEGPIAGRRQGSAGFIGGLQRFVDCLQEPITVLQSLATDNGGAVIYDAVLPQGTMRFAEFFTVKDGRLARDLLIYDAERYRALGGR